MGRFNYENWKRNKDSMESQRGYGYVQAWTCEYYQELMKILESKHKGLLETPNLNLLPYTQGKLDMLKEILYDSCG